MSYIKKKKCQHFIEVCPTPNVNIDDTDRFDFQILEAGGKVLLERDAGEKNLFTQGVTGRAATCERCPLLCFDASDALPLWTDLSCTRFRPRVAVRWQVN